MTPDAAGAWSYRTGDWFAVFGPATTVLLPPAERQRVVELWASIDDGAGFDAVLDALLKHGLGLLPAVVLVGEVDAGTRVLVRGAGVRASLTTDSGPIQIEGPAEATWAERTVAGVSALSVHTSDAGEAPGPDLAIDTGLVRVSRIDRPAVSPAASVSGEQLAPTEAVESVEAAEAASMPAPLVVEPDADPLDQALADQPAEVVPDVGGVPDLDQLPPPPAFPPPPPPPPLGAPLPPFPAPPAPEPPAVSGWPSVPPPPLSPPDDAPSDLGTGPVQGTDPLDEPTDVPLPADEQPDGPPEPDVLVEGVEGEEPDGVDEFDEADDVDDSGYPPPTDHDGLTNAGVSPMPTEGLPGIPGQPMAPSVTKPVATLVISDGQTLDVDRVILVGRAPEARRFTSAEQPLLITVPSRLQEISSTHLEIRPGSGVDHGSAVVTDLGSTNGTVLVQPGLGPEDLKPGIAVQLIPGAVINLGDGVTIDVTRP